jgi:hypothetical protein
MAVVAVSSELVSGTNSLLTGIITGKNHDFGGAGRQAAAQDSGAMRVAGYRCRFVAEN